MRVVFAVLIEHKLYLFCSIHVVLLTLRPMLLIRLQITMTEYYITLG